MHRITQYPLLGANRVKMRYINNLSGEGMPGRMKQKSPARKSAVKVAETSESSPVWYETAAPLGSAVSYVASLSPKFNWVGIYVLKGKMLELGPLHRRSHRAHADPRGPGSLRNGGRGKCGPERRPTCARAKIIWPAAWRPGPSSSCWCATLRAGSSDKSISTATCRGAFGPEEEAGG